MLKKLIAAVAVGAALVALGLLLAAGCGHEEKAPAPAGKRVAVVATILPVYVLALDVAGDSPGLELSLLLAPTSGCPHDYALSPGDLVKLSKARVLLANGAGLEEFLLDKSIRSANPGLQVVKLSDGLKLIPAAPEPPGEARSEHHHHAEEFNGHTFASPRNAAQMVRRIGEALAAADPANAEIYRRNAGEQAGQLEALADEFAAAAKTFPNRKIITLHNVFAYLARDAGLEVAAVIEEEPGMAPGLGEFAKLVDKVKAGQPKPAAIFTEPQYSAKPAEVLSRETGVPLYELDPFASGEARRGAYLAAMRRNLEVLKKALGPAQP